MDVPQLLLSESAKEVSRKRKSNNSSREKKVLWWKPNLGDGSLHKMADLEILRKLTQRNYKIHLIVPATKDRMILLTNNSKVHITSVRMKYLPLILPLARSIMLSILLPFYIISFRPEFIIGEPDVSILSFFPTIILSKMRKIKLILDIRTVPVETFGFKGFLMKSLFVVSVLFAKRYFDGITTITSLMEREVCERFQLASKKRGVWTSGVSIELFSPSKYISAISDFRDKLGISSRFVVFYHGVFSATRGLQQSIEAMEIVKKAYPDIILFLLGSGPVASNLGQLIQEKELESTVIIHNPVDQSEVPRFISMCDVAIIPLPDNQFWRSQSPLKLFEYLAMEKVVILTKIPAHTAVIGDAKCGLFISSVDPVEIAEAIENAYLNRSNLRNWGRTGREIVSEKYTWEKVSIDLDNFLSSIDNIT